MVIDMHTHLMGPAYKSQPEILLKAMDRYGLDKIYVSGLSSMNGNPTKELIRIYNDAVYDFKRAEPDKVEAYVYASPELPGAIDEIKYGIEDNGAIGLKVWMSTFADDKTMDKMRKELMSELAFMSYAPIIFISAKTGQRIERLFELIKFVNEQNTMRISTGMLNDLLADATARVQPPSDKGKRLKIYYITQASVKPPTFVCFCNDAELFHFSYQRYLENQIRATFGLEGTPVKMVIRERGE